VEKYCRAGQATDDNIIRPRKDGICMPDDYSTFIDTHSEHVILNAFLLQQWLCEHNSVLLHTYVASVVQCGVTV